MTGWLPQIGCQSTQETNGALQQPQPAVISETQTVAEGVLGKQAQVLAHGDLARNGKQQLLVADSFLEGSNVSALPEAIEITRAAILEKRGEKWVELLRCDEHLKNAHGYLQGTPANPVTGWKLKFDASGAKGLDLFFTPVEVGAKQGQPSNPDESDRRSVEVRWNKYANRYQSFDSVGKTFLNEAPTLEIPQSVLR
jgi:hypothetical protein